jgi:hypothetical protein
MDKIQRQTDEFDAVKALMRAYNNLPPIVDDDYPEMRHYYESALFQLIRAIRANGRFGQTFSIKNLARCEASNGFNHRLDSWSLSDWLTATLGELGEAANVAKKLNRVRDGLGHMNRGVTEEELRTMLRHEIGDTYSYLDLLAQSQGFLAQDAAEEVFDLVSKRIGYKE